MWEWENVRMRCPELVEGWEWVNDGSMGQWANGPFENLRDHQWVNVGMENSRAVGQHSPVLGRRIHDASPRRGEILIICM
ncbi:MAG: hypothetical protein RL220_1423 [Bacteroidota bacterium]